MAVVGMKITKQANKNSNKKPPNNSDVTIGTPVIQKRLRDWAVFPDLCSQLVVELTCLDFWFSASGHQTGTHINSFPKDLKLTTLACLSESKIEESQKDLLRMQVYLSPLLGTSY